MKALMDRLSYWFGERFAVLEDRTEDTMVPPMDNTLNRMAASFSAMRERLNSISFRRN